MTNRQTGPRLAISKVLQVARQPLTVPEILGLLKDEVASTPHKTTVYRELERLVGLNLVSTITLPDGPVRYEFLKPGEDHHHHALCEGCGVIAELSLDEDLSSLEKAVARQTGFRISKHLLEFIGLCQTCRA
jgi:Fur family ferric uptake transcriptional regulator